MENIQYIVIRKEYKLNEFRVPLVPSDCIILINKGFIVYVEKSMIRCINNMEYMKVGCIMIDDYTMLQHNVDHMLIVGLKDLDIMNSIIFKYKHMYFSHTFKNQNNNNIILSKFKSNGGIIYDMEYFTDDMNNRLITFGYYAGIAGCYMGLFQYYMKQVNGNIMNITPIKNIKHLYYNLNFILNLNEKPNIAIIGNGRCAKGCMFFLNSLNLEYTIFTRTSSKNELVNYDIIFNCIQINSYIEPFITMDTIKTFIKLSILVDISCDYNNIYNPLPIYTRLSTFENPIIHVNDMIDVIAIDNLPSLLPRDSSIDFSSNLVKILTNMEGKYWSKSIKKYIECTSC